MTSESVRAREQPPRDAVGYSDYRRCRLRLASGNRYRDVVLSLVAFDRDKRVLAPGCGGLREGGAQVSRAGYGLVPSPENDVTLLEAKFRCLAARIDADDGQALCTGALDVSRWRNCQAQGPELVAPAAIVSRNFAHLLLCELTELQFECLLLAVSDDPQRH